jgi:hypothetical protein
MCHFSKSQSNYQDKNSKFSLDDTKHLKMKKTLKENVDSSKKTKIRSRSKDSNISDKTHKNPKTKAKVK